MKIERRPDQMDSCEVELNLAAAKTLIEEMFKRAYTNKEVNAWPIINSCFETVEHFAFRLDEKVTVFFGKTVELDVRDYAVNPLDPVKDAEMMERFGLVSGANTPFWWVNQVPGSNDEDSWHLMVCDEELTKDSCILFFTPTELEGENVIFSRQVKVEVETLQFANLIPVTYTNAVFVEGIDKLSLEELMDDQAETYVERHATMRKDAMQQRYEERMKRSEQEEACQAYEPKVVDLEIETRKQLSVVLHMTSDPMEDELKFVRQDVGFYVGANRFEYSEEGVDGARKFCESVIEKHKKNSAEQTAKACVKMLRESFLEVAEEFPIEGVDACDHRNRVWKGAKTIGWPFRSALWVIVEDHMAVFMLHNKELSKCLFAERIPDEPVGWDSRGAKDLARAILLRAFQQSRSWIGKIYDRMTKQYQ